MRRRLALIAAVGCCGLLLFGVVPRNVVVAPRWRIIVLDDTGKPYPHVQVVQWWGHYSRGNVPEFQEQRTGTDGAVVFEMRVVHISRAKELIGALKALSDTGTEASFGTDAWAVIGGPDSKSSAVSVRPEGAARRGNELVSTVRLPAASPALPGKWPFPPPTSSQQR